MEIRQKPPIGWFFSVLDMPLLLAAAHKRHCPHAARTVAVPRFLRTIEDAKDFSASKSDAKDIFASKEGADVGAPPLFSSIP